MFSRDVILDEIERRVAEHEDAIGTHVGEYRDILRTRIACLSQLRAFIIAQPAPDASELVKEARDPRTFWNDAMINKIIDALEVAESIIGPMRKVLDDEQSRRVAAEAQNAGMKSVVDAAEKIMPYLPGESTIRPGRSAHVDAAAALRKALKALDEKT